MALRSDPSVDFENRNNLGGWVLWLLGVLLTAVLAGLGAPCWSDTASGIARLAQKTRSGKKAPA